MINNDPLELGCADLSNHWVPPITMASTQNSRKVVHACCLVDANQFDLENGPCGVKVRFEKEHIPSRFKHWVLMLS
eukprot:358896-Amphidinium_carterae.1